MIGATHNISSCNGNGVAEASNGLGKGFLPAVQVLMELVEECPEMDLSHYCEWMVVGRKGEEKSAQLLSIEVVFFSRSGITFDGVLKFIGPEVCWHG